MRFPTWLVIRGRKVEDRGRGVSPSFRPVPVPSTEADDENRRLFEATYGLIICPECGFKVSVLIGGICRDCAPEIA